MKFIVRDNGLYCCKKLEKGQEIKIWETNNCLFISDPKKDTCDSIYYLEDFKISIESDGRGGSYLQIKGYQYGKTIDHIIIDLE